MDRTVARLHYRKLLAQEMYEAKDQTILRLLAVEEVAGLLHVPVTWVYGRMRKRSLERLPGYRLGKYWRFREEDVLEWLTRRAR